MNPEKTLWARGQCQDLVGLHYYQTEHPETWGKFLKKITVLLYQSTLIEAAILM